ncbi:hypothetical protein B9Z55_026452 [Caenorhabditis nigoni]|nr:hypothetical protein B9Z55_026452 [Caenorhabditis nigoni]
MKNHQDGHLCSENVQNHQHNHIRRRNTLPTSSVESVEAINSNRLSILPNRLKETKGMQSEGRRRQRRTSRKQKGTTQIYKTELSVTLE